MTSEQDVKIALSLLKDIDQKVQEKLGYTPAISYRENYDVDLGIFCERMIEECDIALKKAQENADVRLNVLLLKAKLYGHWQKTIGGLQHKKAIECYEEALQIAKNNSEIEAKVRFVYGVAGSILGVPKEKNISNLQRVIDIVGLDSDMGIQAAKSIEKEKERKDKKCFIATAVYGSEFSEDVMVLKSFRDEYLLKTRMGNTLINFYYLVSPPIAEYIGEKESLKNILRKRVIHPLANLIKIIIKNG